MTGSTLTARVRAAVAVVAPVVLGLLALAAGPGQPAAATTTGTTAVTTGQLTCFAVDVSGSNLAASGGQPPSDPGPVFVRQQVVALYTQVLADLGVAAGQQVGVVTFGTGPGTRIGPLAISGPAARSELVGKLPTALRPSAAEAAWTDWVAGVSGCEQMFRRSGDSRGRLVLLTDGFPQGRPVARQLSSRRSPRRLGGCGPAASPSSRSCTAPGPASRGQPARL